MGTVRGPSCGCSPGDLGFKSVDFSWAQGVLRSPRNLMPVVAPGDQGSGAASPCAAGKPCHLPADPAAPATVDSVHRCIPLFFPILEGLVGLTGLELL